MVFNKDWNCYGRITGISVVAALSALQGWGAGPTPKAENVTTPVILVELFTSEGCSSCPPADALLARIHDKQTASGQLIVGISEHVTYWNRLGWIDPYSAETYTDRQNLYGRRFNLDSVYTPQMVVNGSQQFVGSDGRALQIALQKEGGTALTSVQILSSDSENGVLTVKFTVNGSIPSSGADIVAVLADDVDRSNVLRGENSGRELAHVSVARAMARVATVHSATEQTVQLPIPENFQKDHGRGHHLVLFAQTAGLGPILGADTKPL
jgi:hypothetical protein